MRRPSFIIFLVAVIGIGVAFGWAYQRYFRKENVELLQFTVRRADLQELVRVRGEIAPQQDFNLEFPFSGTVDQIFVSEGNRVGKDEALLQLGTADLELERQRVTAQREGNKNTLFDTLHDAYTKADDAVRDQADQLFDNPRSVSPDVLLANIEIDLERSVELQRRTIETMLDAWQASLDAMTIDEDLPSYGIAARANLYQVKTFLDALALAVNNPNTVQIVSGSPSGAVPAIWKSAVASGRTSVNTAIGALTTAQQALTDTEKQIAIIDEKIRKSTLRAPAVSQVAKIWIERGEEFRVGTPAITLYAFERKIQADVSEIEIGKVRAANGNEVRIRFDAFPGEEFRGRVSAIESKEVVKDGDIYYRVNVAFDPKGFTVRPAMSADLEIVTAVKRNALMIPALAVSERDGAAFVRIEKSGVIEEREVRTGISDGESIEVTEGLEEGETVVVSAD